MPTTSSTKNFTWSLDTCYNNTVPTTSSNQTFTWSSGTCYNNTNYVKYPDFHLELVYLLKHANYGKFPDFHLELMYNCTCCKYPLLLTPRSSYGAQVSAANTYYF
jgi:hypothetical protein